MVVPLVNIPQSPLLFLTSLNYLSSSILDAPDIFFIHIVCFLFQFLEAPLDAIVNNFVTQRNSSEVMAVG